MAKCKKGFKMKDGECSKIKNSRPRKGSKRLFWVIGIVAVLLIIGGIFWSTNNLFKSPINPCADDWTPNRYSTCSFSDVESLGQSEEFYINGCISGGGSNINYYLVLNQCSLDADTQCTPVCVDTQGFPAGFIEQ